MPLVKLDQQTTGVNDIARANAVMVLDEMVQGIHAAREHGITIGMGTDSALTYVTHYDTWRELDLLVRVGGLTPAQTLNAATRTNARILGLDDITGSIEPGKAAIWSCSPRTHSTGSARSPTFEWSSHAAWSSTSHRSPATPSWTPSSTPSDGAVVAVVRRRQ
jgi:cytosine/adenosine deaminase-related metal-dependent hydrolase